MKRYLGKSAVSVIAAISMALPTARHAVADPLLDADIARMEALLSIPCEPVIVKLRNLISAGLAFRGVIAKTEAEYAKEKDRFSGMLGDFALPQKAPDGLSFRFFQEFVRLRAEAAEKGLLAPNNVPKAEEAGGIAVAALSPPPEQGTASTQELLLFQASKLLFFNTKDPEEVKRLNEERKILQQRLDDLEIAYNERRAEFEERYTGDTLDALNQFFNRDARDKLEEVRKAYRELREDMQNLAFSRKFEHCLGDIQDDTPASVVGGGGDPFHVKGADNTLNGIPGMGFVFNAQLQLDPFEPQPIPDFGFILNLKSDPAPFAKLNILSNQVASEQSLIAIQDAAGLLAGTPLELFAAENYLSGKKTIEGFQATLSFLGAVADKAVNSEDSFLLSLLGLSKPEGNANASFTEDFGKAVDATGELADKTIDLAAQAGTATVNFLNEMAEANQAQQELQELGVFGGSLTIPGLGETFGTDPDQIRKIIANTPPEKQAEVAAKLAKLTGAFEKGLDNITSVNAFLAQAAAEELLTLGLSKAAKAAGTFAKLTTAKKAQSKLETAANALEEAAKAKGKKATGISDEIIKTQKEVAENQTLLDNLTDSQIKAIDEADALAKNGTDGAGPLDGSRREFEPGEGVEGASSRSLGDTVDADGNVVEQKGKLLAEGGNAKVFVPDDNPNVVHRFLSTGRTDPLTGEFIPNSTTARDNAGRQVLANADFKDVEILVPEPKPADITFSQIDGDQTLQVQIVPRVDDAAKQIANQGGLMTKGQADAMAKMREEMIQNGIVSTDGSFGNYTFINQGGDNWKVGVIDPGGFEKFNSAADARLFQTVFDAGIKQAAEAEVDSLQGLFFNIAVAGGELGVDMTELAAKNGLSFGDKVEGLNSILLKIPKKSSKNFPALRVKDPTIDISGRVDALDKAKAKVDGLQSDLKAVKAKSDELHEKALELTGSQKSARQVAEDVANEATFARGIADNALKQLAEVEDIRPGSVASAVLALTDNARRGMLLAGKVGAEGQQDANCIRFRAKLAEGDASDEIKKLAKEKCGLAVAEAQQPQAEAQR
ncbi:MAG: hypothetical protein ACPGGK_08185 [Pikeienuella sp.]